MPAYPSVSHLPNDPNCTRGDLVASRSIVEQALSSGVSVTCEEKLDGASCGMRWENGLALIRNKDHVLTKGYQKNTPAKMQFRAAWGWLYDHRDAFTRLADLCNFVPTVYGEWVYATHSIPYTIPDWFIAYEIFQPGAAKWLAAPVARQYLQDAGFFTPPLLYEGAPISLDAIAALRDGSSGWSTAPREGVFVKISSTDQVAARFKAVSKGYVRVGLGRRPIVRQAREAGPAKK